MSAIAIAEQTLTNALSTSITAEAILNEIVNYLTVLTQTSDIQAVKDSYIRFQTDISNHLGGIVIDTAEKQKIRESIDNYIIYIVNRITGYR